MEKAYQSNDHEEVVWLQPPDHIPLDVDLHDGRYAYRDQDNPHYNVDKRTAIVRRDRGHGKRYARIDLDVEAGDEKQSRRM